MHDPENQDPQAEIALRTDRFALMWAVLGRDTNEGIATEMGMSMRQIRRVRNGEVPAGEVFVAQTIFTLRRQAEKLAKFGLEPTFDELFEVVEKRADQSAA